MIGLGSNLGERRAVLARAVRACSALGELLGVSALFETAPVGPPQPVYLNAALLLRTELEPEALLERMLECERAEGRVRRERWGPRTLDLDLLWIEGRAVESERLRVPHPELTARAFALLPLLDVAPLATDPLSGEAYADFAQRIDCSGVRRAAAGRWW